jgi:hypothetical protein
MLPLRLFVFIRHTFNFIVMEKEKIIIDYDGSGVKTLKYTWHALSVLSIVVALAALGIVGGGSVTNETEIIAILGAALFSFIGAAVCLALSNVAKTALYQRAELEQRCEFVDKETAEAEANTSEQEPPSLL